MSHAIRSAIVAVIRSADPTSLVHDYERWTNTPEEYTALFQPVAPKHGPIQAWILSPTGVEEVNWSQQKRAQILTWALRFVRSVQDQDASEKAGFEIVQAVQAAFRFNPTLNQAVWSTRPLAGRATGQQHLVVDRWSLVQLGPVLCHLAECRLATQVFV